MDRLFIFYMKQYFIYKITSPDNNVYVGCTSDFEKRKAKYRLLDKTTKGQRILFLSFNKYGYENHKIEIIYNSFCDSIEAQSLEMFWIRTLMTNKSRWPQMNGLNLTDGGSGTLGNKRSESTCLKMSKSCKNKKAILQFDQNGDIVLEHESLQAAADHVKGARTSIHRAVNGGVDIYKGFSFKYK